MHLICICIEIFTIKRIVKFKYYNKKWKKLLFSFKNLTKKASLATIKFKHVRLQEINRIFSRSCKNYKKKTHNKNLTKLSASVKVIQRNDLFLFSKPFVVYKTKIIKIQIKTNEIIFSVCNVIFKNQTYCYENKST